MDYVLNIIPQMMDGCLISFQVFIITIVLSIPLGILLSLGRVSGIKPLQALIGGYVWILRGSPLMLQIFFVYFVLPSVGIRLPDFESAIVAFVLNYAAYFCEIFRAGIQSVPKGQFEASRSLGMTGPQTMFYVIIPQTIRRVIPTMTSEFILLYKDTSLLAAVGVMELMLYSRSIVSLTGNMTPYIVAACFYLIVTLPLIRVVGNLEKRLADSGGTAPKKKRRKNRRGAFTQMREEITVSTEQAAEVLQEQERLEAHLDDGSEPADMDQALDELQDGIALDVQITDADERGGSR